MRKLLFTILLFATTLAKCENSIQVPPNIIQTSECENKCENDHFWNWQKISLITSTFIVSIVTLILVGTQNKK